MKTKLFTLFAALIATTALWAGNTITYTASAKLSRSTLNVGATTFGPVITDHSFSNGTGTITCSGEITTIGELAFGYCYNLTSVTIPNSVTKIGSFAFSYCSGLTSITIPNSVTTIESNAFSGCSGLTSITIPNSVTTIESNAFSGCSGLTSITIPNSVTTIKNGAFTYVNNIMYNGTAEGSPWGAKCLNGHVEEYFVYADATKTMLCGCSSAAMGEITIPNSVTTIGERAFYGCFNPISVTIPNSVTTIENHSFQNCTGLTSITIPNSVTTIVDGAFQMCTKLTSITIPNSVTTIQGTAFYMCTSLASIIVESGNAVYESRENCNAIVEKATNTLVLGCKNTIIPNSVTTIGDGAFSGCSGLTSITIPNSVTTIESNAFYKCTGLTSVTIPNSVTTIESNAFMDSGLSSITCYAITPPECGIYVFKGISWDAKVYVPASALEDYQRAEEWKDLQLYPIAAEVTPMDDENPVVIPSDQDVTITWPITDGTDTYTLTITKNGETVCVLTFNAQGQLIGIAFAPNRAGSRMLDAAVMTSNGWQFTVTGLDHACKYGYTIDALNASKQSIKHYEGEFATDGYTSLEWVISDKIQGINKMLINGQLFILRDGNLFNATGARVK